MRLVFLKYKSLLVRCEQVGFYILAIWINCGTTYPFNFFHQIFIVNCFLFCTFVAK